VRFPLRIKLLLGAVVLVLLALAASNHFLARYLEALTVENARADLQARLTLAGRALATPEALDEAECNRLATEVGRHGATEVRVVSANRRVLARSTNARADLPEGLPELRAARDGAGGVQVRADLAPSDPRLFGALPLRSAGGAVVLHVSRPLPEIETAVVGMQRLLGRGLVLALLLVVVVTVAGPLVVAREVRDVTEAARRMSEGDFGARVQLDDEDPYAPLAQALDQLSSNLSHTVDELRGERDLVARILEAMEEGVLVLDQDRKIVLLNQALSSMLLLAPRAAGEGDGPSSPLDLEGKPLSEVAANPELEALLDRTHLASARATRELEVGDLKPRRLMVRATRLTTAPWGFLIVFIDVTEVRRLESLRRDFVANVSHELRTPVASILSAAETLGTAAHGDPAAAERFLAIIQRNAARLQLLVEDLLDLSRIESRAYRLNVEALAADRLVADILSLFRERAEARHVRLVADVPPDLPPVYTDRKAIEQVLVNLVDNAVKYIPEAATITVSVAPKGERVLFVVSDTGAGIDAVHLPRLFERFYRVDPGRSRDRGGSGLGLAIVKHLVEAMGGNVSVDSVVGQGTRFTVDLPFARPAAAPAAGEDA
jgi:two-component system phosphate regulon sensor histidine kinase PhoR